LVSGISCPVGFKNGTSGDVQIAIDAILSAAHSHAFLGLTKFGQSAILVTTGNPDCHMILRGGREWSTTPPKAWPKPPRRWKKPAFSPAS
jgi:3-deoxy-7-phosphoheptulonate synthase